MSVEVSLEGVLGVPGEATDWLVSARDALGRLCGGQLRSAFLDVTDHDRPALRCGLFPGAEDVELVVPAPGRLEATARTSASGPGYHRYVCATLAALSDATDVVWARPGPTPGDAEGQALDWLRVVAKEMSEAAARGATGLGVSLPAETLFLFPGDVLTPLGPRSFEWFEDVASGASTGADIFPWWDEGLGAAYYLGRALVLMWSDVRWRRPETEGETAVLREVCSSLDQALELDPDLDLPWREWAEVLGFLGERSDLRDLVVTRAMACDGRLVGYRRQAVRARIGGGPWTVDVPGSFAERCEDDGYTWVAWGPRAAVRARATSLSSSPFDPSATPPHPGALLEYVQDARLTRRAWLERGSSHWQLGGHAWSDESFVSVQVTFEPALERWALSTWASVSAQ